MTESGTECYACGEIIEEDEWVIPLKTYRATYFGDDDKISLNADETVETIIHADCLKHSLQPGTE